MPDTPYASSFGPENCPECGGWRGDHGVDCSRILIGRDHRLWPLTRAALNERRAAGHAPGCFGLVMTDDGLECDCRPAPSARHVEPFTETEGLHLDPNLDMP